MKKQIKKTIDSVGQAAKRTHEKTIEAITSTARYIRTKNPAVVALFIATLIIMAISLVIFILLVEAEQALNQFGTYFGSIFSSIALIWLIASHVLTRVDLRDQRKILTQ